MQVSIQSLAYTQSCLNGGKKSSTFNGHNGYPRNTHKRGELILG